ncbi:MAG: nonstructural protein [Microvirus sp.]|nr:MAG: nonstructural protein [Microvirus sp.]
MLLNAYTVYDNKALNYSPPFFVNTDGAAVRMFADIANDMGTNVGRHPADFSLFCIGSFSDSDGSLERTLPIRHVIDATALLTIKPKGDLFAPLGAGNGHVENLGAK